MKTRIKHTLSAMLTVVFLISVIPFPQAADQQHTTPALTINLPGERLEGAVAGASYQYSTNSGSTWREFVADASGNLDISGILNGVDIELLLRRAASGGFSASEKAALTLPKKGAGPSRDEVKVSYAGADEGKVKFLIDSLGNTIEYRKAFTSDWIPCAASELELDAPSVIERTFTFSFRYQGTASTAPSSVINRTVYAKKPAPNIAFSLFNEVIANIQKGKMEIDIDDTGYVDVEDFAPHYSSADNKIYLRDIIDTINTPETRIIKIRLKGTDDSPPSADKYITLYGRREAPDSLFYDYVKMKITGITSQMEYRIKPDPSEYNTKKWSSTTKTELDISKFLSPDSDVQFEVRYRATKTTAASQTTEDITLSMLAPGPTVTINMQEQRLEGLDPYENYQYSKNNKTFTTFTADQDGNYSVARLLGSASFKLFVRKAATQSEPYTAATEVTVGRISNITTVFKLEYSDNDVKIAGTTAAMEYRVPPSKDWISCTDDMVLPIPESTMTIAIRTKGESGKSPSAEKTVRINAGKASPTSIKYDTSTELLSGLAANMQISYNDGAFTDYAGSPETTYSLSDKITALGDDEKLTVKVRLKAIGTQPATSPRIFTIYPRPDQPDSFDFDPDAQKILGTGSKMQYRALKAGVWTGWSGISGSSLGVSKLILDGFEKVEIRIKAVTGKTSASLAREVSIAP